MFTELRFIAVDCIKAISLRSYIMQLSIAVYGEDTKNTFFVRALVRTYLLPWLWWDMEISLSKKIISLFKSEKSIFKSIHTSPQRDQYIVYYADPGSKHWFQHFIKIRLLRKVEIISALFHVGLASFGTTRGRSGSLVTSRASHADRRGNVKLAPNNE